ncbi:MAG: NAD(P)H-hydrate dehydratase [Oscillospiraceae bacterium]
MRLCNSKTMADADSRAIHVLGVPSCLLMTNAARHLADAALELLHENKRALIFCGSGNNGGDGIATAVRLLSQGISLRCFLVGKREKMTADTAEMERRLIEVGGVLEDFSPKNAEIPKLAMDAGVIIDAIFGIGLSREIKGDALAAVKIINGAKAPVISADIPSGVEADTGRILGEAVNADLTLTFSMAKPGHFAEPGCCCRGQLRVFDIGLPKEILDEIQTDVFSIGLGELFLPKRPKISHKGDYGRLLIIGGCTGFTGAPALCARAAEKAGAGLVSLGVPREIYPIEASRLWSSMPFPLEDDKGKLSLSALPQILEKLSQSDACVIGCGLSRGAELTELVRSLLHTSAKPLVIDADGLFALGNDPETIKSAQTPPILTPHEGEFLRLGGVLTGDRISDARSFAKSRNCVLVLKGHRTICAFPEGEVYIIDAGNPGMAKGGSGDVLAGLIGGLLVQLPQKQAVLSACLIHGAAGDSAAKRLGEYSLLPEDIIYEVAQITKIMTR